MQRCFAVTCPTITNEYLFGNRDRVLQSLPHQEQPIEVGRQPARGEGKVLGAARLDVADRSATENLRRFAA